MGKECYPSALPGQWAAEAPPFSSPCPTCPHSFPKLSFQLSRAQCSLSPYLVAPSRATSPAPPSGWRECGVRSCKARSRPPHRLVSIGSATGLGVKPCSDWPVSPVRPALAMVTTLGPPGEFHIPPPPATPLPLLALPAFHGRPLPHCPATGPGFHRDGDWPGDSKRGLKKLGSSLGCGGRLPGSCASLQSSSLA